ncbi:MAG: acyl-CoA reductase [Pedobacter sp.]
MLSLTIEKLIIAFNKLSLFLADPDHDFKELITSARNSNAWFTEQEVYRSLNALSEMLKEDELRIWFQDIKITTTPKRVGLILAGNIPLVGFHDVISVLATGNIALIKLSSSDDKLLPAVLHQLCTIEPALQEQIIYVERLKDFESVIATGSNNTSRYFEYYFGKVPNIIRKNRTSVAVLTGKELPEDIAKLGHDFFDYFGLGCRNVSKVYLPQDYDIKNFFEPLEQYNDIINHFKYNNNYDYNKSIYLVNSAKHYDNGFLLLKADTGFSSPLAVLYFERYQELEEVEAALNSNRENLQCVVSNADLQIGTAILGFGESQHPKLWDYADNINTIEFLNSLQAG